MLQYGAMSKISFVLTRPAPSSGFALCAYDTFELDNRELSSIRQTIIGFAAPMSGLIWGEAFVDNILDIDKVHLLDAEFLSKYDIASPGLGCHKDEQARSRAERAPRFFLRGKQKWKQMWGLCFGRTTVYRTPVPFTCVAPVRLQYVGDDQVFLAAVATAARPATDVAVGRLRTRNRQFTTLCFTYGGQDGYYPCPTCGGALVVSQIWWDAAHASVCARRLRDLRARQLATVPQSLPATLPQHIQEDILSIARSVFSNSRASYRECTALHFGLGTSLNKYATKGSKVYKDLEAKLIAFMRLWGMKFSSVIVNRYVGGNAMGLHVDNNVRGHSGQVVAIFGDYTGGDLVVHAAGGTMRYRHGVHIIDADQLHEVTAVTSGVRFSVISYCKDLTRVPSCITDNLRERGYQLPL